MSKAPAPAPALLCVRRTFEPARYSQHYLASAYLQLVSTSRRRVSPLPKQARIAPATRAGAAS